MTKTTPEYIPPLTESMLQRQNDIDALRLLITQRRLYTKAKRWQSVRWIGLLVVGIAAPIVAVAWPSAAVLIGAIAGAWLFLGRTFLAWMEARLMTKAASIQEDFDLYVFGMPRVIERSARPSLEDIAKLAGSDESIQATAEREHLIEWYPFNQADSGWAAIAIAQRANASYSDRLIRATVTVWTVLTLAWVTALVVFSVVVDLPLDIFLLGVVLPVLPAVLDVIDYIKSAVSAARDRGDLARAIETRLSDGENSIDGQELLVWQERTFDLRRTTPQIPNWLYSLTRKQNEAAMNSAAEQLGRQARGSEK